MVESLARRGLQVTLVGRSSHLLGDFDRTFAAPVYNAMRHCGVALNLAQSVQGLAGDSGRITHVETDVERLQADMVLVATETEPSAGLARAAGLAVGRSGAIAVDDQMQASRTGIWAAGDCVEVKHVVSGQKVHVP